MEVFGHRWIKADYASSGFTVRKKTIDSVTGGRFNEVYEKVKQSHVDHFPSWPDFRWRAHTAVWAAKTGLARPGTFIELGVHTGFLSHVICEYLGFAENGRRFILFDTFNGIPVQEVPVAERARAVSHNDSYYSEVYETTREMFKPYPSVELVRGILPDTLENVDIEEVAYLSIDLNYSTVEIESIKSLWDKLSPGCVVLLDDYAWRGHEAQKRAWDDWALEANTMVFTIPTGQGIIVK